MSKKLSTNFWLLSAVVVLLSSFITALTPSLALAADAQAITTATANYSRYAAISACFSKNADHAEYLIQSKREGDSIYGTVSRESFIEYFDDAEIGRDQLSLIWGTNYSGPVSKSKTSVLGYLPEETTSNDGLVSCEEAIFLFYDMVSAKYTPQQFITDLGYKQGMHEVQVSDTKSGVKRTTLNVWKYESNNSLKANFDAIVKKLGVLTNEPEGGGYYIGMSALLAQGDNNCSMSTISNPDPGGTEVKYANASTLDDSNNKWGLINQVVPDPATGGISVQKVIFSIPNGNLSKEMNAYPRPDGNGSRADCQNIINLVNGNEGAKELIAVYQKSDLEEYSKALCNSTYLKNPGVVNSNDCNSYLRKCISSNPEIVPGKDAMAECMSKTKIGMTKAQLLQIFQSVPASNPSVTCPDGTIVPGGKCNAPPGDPVALCTAGALGWVLCPLTQMTVNGIENLAEFIEELLQYKPLVLGSNQSNSILPIWQVVVGIANILLALGFMVVIFSQATSFGLSAYGIKKMLPRLVAAAILINMSYFICAAAVDISNILGGSIKGIISSAMAQVPATGTDAQNAIDPNSFAQAVKVIVASISVVGVAVVAGLVGALAFILPILLSALLAFLTAFLVIALRQVLVTLLIIISPLAFVAFFLPNTQSLFKKWGKTFVVLLLMYPLIMALLYGSVLMSRIILVTNNGPNKNMIIEIMAFVVLFVPLFMTPFLMKLAGGILERFAGFVNDRQKGIIDRSRKFASQKQKNSKLGQMMERRKNAVDTDAQRRALKSMGGRLKGLSTLGLGKGASELLGTQVDDINSQLHDQSVQHELSNVSKNFDNKDRTVGSDRGIVAMAKAYKAAAASGNKVKADAIALHAASGGADEYKTFHELLQGNSSDSKLNEAFGEKYKVTGDAEQSKILNDSMRFVYKAKAGELAPKSPALVSVLQRGNSSDNISDEMVNENMMRMYNKVSAEKHAQFSSDQAKVAAEYATDDVLRELIENKGGKHSLGASAKEAYQKEYDKMMRGERRFKNGNFEEPMPKPSADDYSI